MAPPKTDADKQKLVQLFREKSSKYVMDNYLNSDVCILKWLEFKNWNVDRAEKAFRKSLEWRAKFDVDSVLDENFDDLNSNLRYYIDGVDKDGRTIITIPMNECYIRNEIDAGVTNKERVKRFMLYIVETAAKMIKDKYLENEASPTTFVFIMDADQVDVADVPPKVITTCLEIARACEDNFPGMIEAIYVVNASKAAKTMFNFYKNMIKNTTTGLLHVYGNKREKWQHKILRNIEPDQIRERFGGTRPDEKSEVSVDGPSYEKTVEKLKALSKDEELAEELKKELKSIKKEFKKMNTDK